MIEAQSIPIAFLQLLNDNSTEYPTKINALQRFNLYEEVYSCFVLFSIIPLYIHCVLLLTTLQVILALLYRTFHYVSSKWLYIPEQNFLTCYNVERGGGMPPVRSCEGETKRKGSIHYSISYSLCISLLIAVGLGEAPIYYVESVFWLHGLMLACFFLTAVVLRYS